MPSTYTLNNGIELIATGEQSGTWGDTTNTNLALIDTALDGQVTVTLASAGTSGAPNALAISDGAASNGRNRMIIFADGGDLGATAYVQLTPNDAEKIVYIRNNLSGSRSIIVFQGTYNASNDYEIPAGTTAVIFFNGGGAGAVAANVFNNAYFDGLRLGAVSVTAILDEDNMASDSATALATQQSIKAYVDAQVAANNELSEVLANGNTSGGNNIQMTTTDEVQFRDTALKISSSADGQLDIDADVEVEIVAPTLDIDASTAVTIDTTTLTMTGSVNVVGDLDVDNLNLNGNSIISTNANGNIALTPNGTGEVDISKVDIDGGTIDGTTIGGTTPAAGTFTTANATTVDTTNLEVTTLKAKDGTSAGSIADATGVVTLASSVLTTTDINGGTIDGAVIGGSSAAAGTFTTVTASGDLTIADKIVHSGDTDTSIRFPAADTVTVETSGAERVRVNSSGNVGINKTSPTVALDVVGRIRSSDTVMILQSTGDLSTTGVGYLSFRGSDTVERGYVGFGAGNADFYVQNINNANIRFGTNATERMRITSTGNVGIGTTSPNATLEVYNASEGEYMRVGGANVNRALRFTSATAGTSAGALHTLNAASGEGVIAFATGSTERMRINAVGNVGIGTSSPAYDLDVDGSIGLTADATNKYYLTNDGAFKIALAGTGSLVTVNSSGNVGIGSTGPQAALDLGNGTAGRGITWAGNTGSARYNSIFSSYSGASLVLSSLFHGSTSADSYVTSLTGTTRAAGIRLNWTNDNGIQFFTDTAAAKTAGNAFVPSERMRIDSSGNLLVGTTSITTSTAGFKWRQDLSRLLTVADGGSSASFGRLTSDGDIVLFQKDGTTVGSIGSSAGNSIFVGSGDVGVRFSDVNDAIYPMTTGGVNRDAATDLGLSTVRFKDLYLSGGVKGYGTSTFGIGLANGISVGGSSTTNAAIFGTSANQDVNMSANGTGNVKFLTGASASGLGSASERMRIDSSGNVGIGTSSPTARLTVIGADNSTQAVFGGALGTTSRGLRLALATVFANNDTVVYDAQYTDGGSNFGNHVFQTAGVERLRIDSSGNLLIGGTTAGTASAGNLVLVNGTAPTGNVTNGITLFAEDVSSSSELKVRDEAGNVTTLSPHNFDLIPEGPSEDMAWSYYSERDGKRINVDMLKAIRILEQLSGEKLVHMT